jgi:putative transposase
MPLLTEIEFTSWCSRLSLSREAEEIVRKIRSSPPARKVRQNKQSVPGFYSSRKMGCTIQFESHTVEFPHVYAHEHDPDVLEYYCQPSTFDIDYVSGKGRRLHHPHTPDYFSIRRDSAGWLETKSKEDLPVLSQRQPHRYRFESGVWRCPPGEAYAEPLGLTYTLASSADVSPEFHRNANFMDDYLRDPPQVPDAIYALVSKHFERFPAMTLADLFDVTSGEVSKDEIYALIVKSAVHVDWNTGLFVNPETIRVFASAETAANFSRATAKGRPKSGIFHVELGAQYLWDGRAWSVANVGDHIVALRGEGTSFTEVPLDSFHSLVTAGRIVETGSVQTAHEHPEIADCFRSAGPKEQEEANRRFMAILPYLDREPGDANYPKDRSERRWLALYNNAKNVYGNGMIGLYPHRNQSGNRTSRLNDDVRRDMATFIEDHHETATQHPVYESWSVFKVQCEVTGLPPPAYSTFRQAVLDRPRDIQENKRRGHRAAYKHQEFYWYLDQSTPRHGDRPFEIAHIDHTEVDIELKSLETGEELDRPWWTIMTDASTRKVLAKYQSFDPPSYRSCMMVLRDCVRRHGRLPQIIVVDGGPEFKSTFFDTVLASYECTKKTRPAAKARFGSTCERIFGTSNTQLVHNLAGNTQITKTPRITTKSHNPKNLAVWDFAGLDERSDSYMFETYETIRHPALSQTPREAFQRGLANYGLRKHRWIVYDMDFLLNTSPSTPKGTAKVIPSRGVTINYFSYWTDGFRDPGVLNKQVPVRYDPFNLGIAWAYLKGRWVECRSAHYSEMVGKSEKQLRLATAINRNERSRSAFERSNSTPRSIARMLNDTYKEEAIRRQQIRDRESRESRIHLLPKPDTGDQVVELVGDTSVREFSRSGISDTEFEVYESL